LRNPDFILKKDGTMNLLRTVKLFGSLIALGASIQATATPFNVDITVDNSYALFYGNATQATNFVGSDGNWPSVESYNFDLPNNDFIYVVTQSDLSVAQGFLAQFTNLTTNERFYSNDPQWQVTATGRYGSAPYTGSASDFAELTSQIVAANAGANPSHGWVNTTAGNANGSAPWGTLSAIDSAARWSWYDSKHDGSDPTQGGFNHDEYLIFRISVGATSVPEPSALILLVVGLFGLGYARSRRA
jgi:hypothetical protein